MDDDNTHNNMGVEITTDDLPPPSGERHVLQPREELRLEVAFGSSSSSNNNSDAISLILQKGSAELYGCELALQKVYSIPQGGIKIALFTWHGAVIDLLQGGVADSDDETMSYTSDETDCNVAYVNTHAQLEALRDDASVASQHGDTSGGPRVLVVGPAESGKTTLCKTLVAYACKVGRTPLWVDLDPNDNSISVPGTLSVAPMISTAISVESYATTGLPANTVHPLVVFHGNNTEGECYQNGIHPDLFKAQVDHLAKTINSRLQHDDNANASGIIVNTNGWIRDEGYELLLHTAKALSISVILVLGHDRLFSLLNSHYKKIKANDNDDSIITPKIVKLPRSGGVVSPPKEFQRQCRSRAVKRYFYGDLVADSSAGDDGKENSSGNRKINQLTPFLVQLQLSDLKIYKVSTMALSSSLLPVAQQQSTDSIQLVEMDLDENAKTMETLQHALLAVCHPLAVQKYIETGRARDLVTAGVAGFCAVERIVTETNQIHLLSPCAGALPSTTLIVGNITWME
jgi:polyribonucleotide 5'-hydroxyl-kinase